MRGESQGVTPGVAFLVEDVTVSGFGSAGVAWEEFRARPRVTIANDFGCWLCVGLACEQGGLPLPLPVSRSIPAGIDVTPPLESAGVDDAGNGARCTLHVLSGSALGEGSAGIFTAVFQLLSKSRFHRWYRASLVVLGERLPFF